MKNIPGPLDYAKLSQRHRPADPAALRDEVRRLHTTGLTPIDISVAIRLDLVAVHEMLAEAQG